MRWSLWISLCSQILLFPVVLTADVGTVMGGSLLVLPGFHSHVSSWFPEGDFTLRVFIFLHMCLLWLLHVISPSRAFPQTSTKSLTEAPIIWVHCVPLLKWVSCLDSSESEPSLFSSSDDFESKFNFHPVEDLPPPEEYRHFNRVYPSKTSKGMSWEITG